MFSECWWFPLTLLEKILRTPILTVAAICHSQESNAELLGILVTTSSDIIVSCEQTLAVKQHSVYSTFVVFCNFCSTYNVYTAIQSLNSLACPSAYRGR